MAEAPDFIPDGEVPAAPAVAPDFIPDHEAQSMSSKAPDFIPDGETPEEKYSSTGQQVMTGIEAVGRGVTGGLSDALAVGMRKGATALGVPEEYLHYVAPAPEEIYARKEENPTISTTGEIAGNVALMSKLPQVGSKAINGMIQMGLIQGGDEISKAMLGHGDPTSAVAANIAEAGAAGLLLGGVFGKLEKAASKGLKTIENATWGTKLKSLITGAGHAATFPEQEIVSLAKSGLTKSEAKVLSEKEFKRGQELIKIYAQKAPKWAARTAAPALGAHFGGLPGAIIGGSIEQALEKSVPNLSQKYVGPAILKAAASGHINNISKILDHASQMEKGAKKLNKGVEALFKSGSDKALDFVHSERDREKLREFIEDGGVEKEVRDEAESMSQEPSSQNYAEGGQVTQDLQQSDPIAQIYPEQNVLLSTARGRISGYLNSVRPMQNAMKLPFDSDVQKDPVKDRQYNKALDLANKPLSILKHIKDGTLLPTHMEMFTQMYPELHGHLSKKITEEIAKMQMDKRSRPPYKVRQSLSLFLGTSLDSTVTPAGIQAAQQVFINQKAVRNTPPSSSTGLESLGKSAMTPLQARTQRLNKG